MKAHSPSSAVSRRRFVRQVAHGAAWVGAAAYTRDPALAAEANPFAYDVKRFSQTDPKLIGWRETARRSCPVKDARRLALAPDDSILVAAGTQVVRWTASGERPSLELGAPVRCVGVAPDGLFFVGLTDRIAVFDAAGRRQADWPSPGPKTWFTGFAITANEVFAADSGQRLVWRYDRTGRVLGRIGVRDSKRNVPGLVLPSPFLDVRLHPDGLLRVNNTGRHRVEAYTVEGDFELAWGEPSAAIHGFCGCCNPIGLALLADGRTVTCEKGLPRVKVHRPDGSLESVVAGTETFAENARQCGNPGNCTRGGLDVAVDSRGRILILDRATGEVRTMEPIAPA
jgi:hypothetical protein